MALAGGLVLLGAGYALWAAFGPEPGAPVGPEDVPLDAVVRSPAPRPPSPPDRRLPERAPPPREGIYDPREEFPSAGEEFAGKRLFIPSMAQTQTVRGDRVREALLALPGVYLRWDSAEVKESFLRTELRLRPDVGMDATEWHPAGAPIRPAFELLESVGFRAWIRPPLVRIGAHQEPIPDR